MMNSTDTNYPYYSYIPARLIAGVFAGIVLISLIAWFVQSLRVKCRPPPLSIFLFVIHLATFIELVLRATLNVNVLSTLMLYRITAPLLSVPPRMLLFANYHCLVELRGKKPRGIVDRVIDICVPVGAITADVLLGIANELSFKPNYVSLSFRLRQASAGLVLVLAVSFYVVWYLAVPHARRRYILSLLAVSSICVLIEAIYVQAISIPSIFFALSQNEVWFYIGHVIPIVFACIIWSIFHPSRSLPPPQPAVPHDETGKELLPRPLSV
jgi:phage shock protein PspC (stress-responsive transcriptional regulator)